jgi:hypothetical protein
VFPLLEHAPDPLATAWLQASMTTFAERVASFLPGPFAAYARVYHPVEYNDGTTAAPPAWRELAAAADADLRDPLAFAALRTSLEPRMRADEGTLPRALLEPLVEHLRPATATPDRCVFAVWEGFGASAIPPPVGPTLELPHRQYHVFVGPIEGARTSFSAVPWVHQSANLWWPADRAWCVATEVDHAWTYVGGAQSCIRALLADARLEATETTAAATW